MLCKMVIRMVHVHGKILASLRKELGFEVALVSLDKKKLKLMIMLY